MTCSMSADRGSRPSRRCGAGRSPPARVRRGRGRGRRGPRRGRRRAGRACARAATSATSTRVRNSAANSGSVLSAVITAPNVWVVSWSVRPPMPQNAVSRSVRRSPESGTGGRGLLGGQGVDDERRLGVPPSVERRLGGLGALRDGVHGEAVVADLREHLEGGVEDLALAVTLDPGAEVGRLLRRGSSGVLSPVVHLHETKRFRSMRR